MERLVRGWCHSQDKGLFTHLDTALLSPWPISSSLACCPHWAGQKYMRKLEFCGRHLSQALTTRRSHPLLFGLLKLNNSSVCYVYYGNAVTSAGLAKQHIAVKHWTVILPAGMVVSSSVPSRCRFVGLCPQKLFWRNIWSSLARSI